MGRSGSSRSVVRPRAARCSPCSSAARLTAGAGPEETAPTSVLRLIRRLIVVLGAAAIPAQAAPPALTLRLVVNGLSSPVEIAHAGDGSGRLFVAEQAGVIKIVKDGAVLATPFLDLTAKVLSGGERGLLGLAFHPLYRANGKFYVYYTQQTDGTVVVSEFLRSATDADVANAATERQVLTVTRSTPEAAAGLACSWRRAASARAVWIRTGTRSTGTTAPTAPAARARTLSSAAAPCRTPPARFAAVLN